MTIVSGQSTRTADEIISLFDLLFGEPQNTVLRHAKKDPEYLPCDAFNPQNRVLFANKFATSALHEISHWCIAGKERLLQVDYGYWYEPDGRSPQQQERFLNFEANNQGLEWILAIACNIDFHISTDNLDCNETDRLKQNQEFALKVLYSTLNYLERGLPPRAKMFVEGCWDQFGTKPSFDREILNLKAHQSLPNH